MGSFLFSKITHTRRVRNMNGLLNKSKHFWNKNASTILTSVGAVGVVATSVSTVKATTKASQLLEDAKTEKGECLTKTEKVKVALPSYIPVIALGAATIVCIFGANALNKRQQASMAGAYVFLDQTYKEYKSKVNSMYGDNAESQIWALKIKPVKRQRWETCFDRRTI